VSGSVLNPDQRADAWQRLGSEQFDVVVIGGGVVGAGAALDAATRGLKVALVEARDFASGTSSRSSKMFHGGLRYLEQLEFGLVREALHERELSLTTLAPHLVKPLPFLFPLTNRWWERPYVAAGIFLYDQLGGAKSVPAQKHLTKSGALRLAPGLRRSSLIGGIRYYDTVVDDARHTMTVARTAAHYGAVVRTSTQVVSLLREGDRVVGVRIRDSENATVGTVRAHVVINATGVWTDEIQALSKQRGRFRVRASKGVHVVVPRDRIVSEVALILRTEKSVLFVIPWGTHWIIGTTDTDWDLDLAHPAATKADIDYILERVNAVLATPLTHDDIDGVYAGLRPLLAGENEETSQLSREHAVASPAPGLVAIAGGKYTTYRVMAADAVDAAAEFVPARVAPSITDKVPLVGADGYFALVNQTEHVGARYGLHPYRVRHLLDRYGSLLDDVLALGSKEGGDPELLTPITEAPVYLKVEAFYAAAAEGALHLEDILARRMRISIEYPHRGVDCAREVAEVVAPVLGWSDADIDREVATYIARVEAEVLSQTQPDDASADALRAAAPEARAEILEPVPLN
jgi:glycerol-3-phosphate dehydrogenase